VHNISLNYFAQPELLVSKDGYFSKPGFFRQHAAASRFKIAGGKLVARSWADLICKHRLPVYDLLLTLPVRGQFEDQN
jgi:hypothetical protein